MKLKPKIHILLLGIACLTLLFPAPARADGIIIPMPPICDPCPPPPCRLPLPCPPPTPMVQLAIRYHHVTVTIQDQVATTHVDQVFHNPNEWAVEGTYMFPLPVDASVSSFVLWVDGQPVEGQILDAEQARQQYQEIVSSLRDPALLEYAGRGAVQAHIFPIPPGGERRVELEYTQALSAENGLVRYIYPLNTEKFSLWPLEQVSISVDVQASVPIRAMYSPSHSVQVSRENERYMKAGYEANQVTPDTDFALYYSLGEQQALHLLSYRNAADAADPDGFFLLLLAPRAETSGPALAKDVILVLDRSGSMEGEKFRQAQDALVYILKHLNSDDHFNVIAFSTGLESYANRLQTASQADQAIQWVEQLSAQGSTDINRALLEAAAMANNERPTYLIFLTDGLPTEGVIDSQQILDNLESAAAKNLRLFAFGVGYDVDTFLLDSLAQAHHGTSSYVLPDERLDESLSAFYTKISTPVLTDLSLDFGGLTVYDMYPTPLPDLFSGSQIILVGRYRKGGETTIKLSGQVDNERQSFEFTEQVFALQSGQEYPEYTLPRLWATRKIGYLLNQIRLHGPDEETISQIVKLSIRYGIVTPYTSYLVTEALPLGADEQERIASEQFDKLQAAPAAPASGEAAVKQAAEQGALSGALAPSTPSIEVANRVRLAGSNTYVLDGDTWVDTRFDPEQMQTTKVAFLSTEYFELLRARPELGPAFALGQSVIVILDGIAYESVAADASVAPLTIPPTYTPEQQPFQTTSTPPPVSIENPGATPDTPISSAPMQVCSSAALLFVLALLWWLRRFV